MSFLRRALVVLVSCASLALTPSAWAIIDSTLQMQTGNPSSATADTSNHAHFLIQRAQFAMDYNDTTREPNWVAWDLTTGDVGGSGRSPDFFQDTSLPSGFYQVLPTDYSGSGYDRGHMCPSADRTVDRANNDVVFLMSNMIPQAPDNNQGVWASFETECRNIAAAGNEVLIISGPSGFAGSTIASGVAIAGYTWKIAIVVPLGSGTALSRITASTRVIAIKIPNTAGVRSNPWEQYVVSAATIEGDTGYNFFRDVPTGTANTLRVKVDGQTSTGLPTITTQPVAQTATVGGSATFTVAATSTTDTNFTYQWLKDDAEIVGATSASLTITNAQAAALGNYAATVTNSIGSVTSTSAALVINGIPPSISTQPVAKVANAGTTVTFLGGAAGSPALSYQWRKGGANLTPTSTVSGVYSSSLTLTNVQAADAGSYDFTVTNAVSTVTSNAVSLTVNAVAPTITTPPVSQTVTIGTNGTFTVAASGTAPFTYQWRKDGADLTDGGRISGSTGTTLAIAAFVVGDAGSYDVVVTNSVSSTTSAAATLTVSTVVAPIVWDFTAATPTSGLPSDVTGGTVTQGNNNGTTTMLSTTSVSSGYTGSTGTFNAGAAARTGALSQAASGSAYFEFTLTPDAGKQLKATGITFGSRSTGTGPVAYSIYTSVDNYAAAIATGTLAATSTWALQSPAFTAVTGLSGTAVTFRIYGYGGAGSPAAGTANWRIDDLKLSAAAVAAAPLTPAVVSTTPANSATAVNPSTTISVTFNQPVTVAGSWFNINSAFNGTVAATVTGGPTTYTLTPPVNFQDNDTVTATFFSAQITDTASGTLHPTSNTVISFNVAAPIAPTITTAPVAQTVAAGSSATFSVAASGTAPFSYQWRKGGSPISGASSASLTLTNVQAVDAANYDVLITNAGGSITSTPVALTVTPVSPTITTAPVAASVVYGANATFTVAATGSTPFTYQWRKNGVALVNGAVANAATVSGATGVTLTLTATSNLDAGSYDVIVTNTAGNVTSTPVTLTITLPPAGPAMNYAGGAYTQNFDTLPNTGTFTFAASGPYALDAAQPNGVGASGMAGWSFTRYAGTGSTALFKFDTGSSNAGGTNSYGTAAATDRALGSLGSGGNVPRFGVAFVNTTGQTITQFTLGYTGEQWRHGGATVPNKLTFSYATDATNINVGGFTAATTLDFIAPIITATTAALDGNLAANRVVIAPVTITGLSWAPGQTLTLRWTDVDDAGSDDGLGIDDLTFSAGAAVAITTQPATQNVTAGSSVTFTVAATGSPAPTYQWRKDGSAITDATSSSFTIASAAALDVGNYDVVVTNTIGTATSSTAALTVNASSATVTLSGLATVYDGSAKVATATTSPANLTTSITYDGGATAPSAAGSYAVVATVTQANYAGSANGTLVISPAAATVTLGGLAATFDGTAKAVTVTTSPAGLATSITYAGSATAPSAVASYAVVATITSANYTGSASGTLVISAPAQQAQTITFAPLADRQTNAASAALTATASSGLPVTFSVVSGPAAVSGSTLTLTGATGTVVVRASQAGNASFTAAPNVDRSFAVTAAAAAPVITSQPAPKTALAGSNVTFTVVATGVPAPTYQWRKNGAAISGATAATLTLSNVQTADAASYDVVVSNASGAVTSSLAALTVTATPTAPVITRQPANLVALVGNTATFTVAATGAPAPTYQWRKDGVALVGATDATLTLASLTAAQAGGYSVVVTNSVGSVTSRTAILGVIRRSFAGSYFGTLGNGGTFALLIRDDNTGIFLGFAPGSGTAYLSRGVSVDENGNFSFSTLVTTPTAANVGDRLSLPGDTFESLATGELLFSGSISESGALSGSANGVTMAATKSPTGATESVAGYYEAGAAGSSAQTLTIVSPSGQVFVLAQTPTGFDGGTGTVTASGQINVVTTAGQTIAATVSADTDAVTATLTDKTGATTTFTGTAENSAASADQRVVNLSSRVRTATGDQVAIAGFVISGEESKTVLIRAVGPTLANFGVTGALTAPKLDLYRGGAVIGSNTAWGTATNTSEIAGAATRAGAFALTAGSADSVILTTLAPGAYTAIVSSASGSSGVALVEVYDLSGAAAGQKLINISTRAVAGTGSDTLIAGVVVAGSVPKRVLIRAAGPTLAQFGLSGVLTRPQLTLYSGSNVVVQNAGWSTSADATAIADAATRVGAFAFAAGSLDAALIVNLPPGAYTAQVTGVNGVTGIAVVEIYELP